MTVYDDVREVPTGRRSVALGTFDGVHLGHRAIVEAAVAAAAPHDATPIAATIHPRPASVLRGGVAPDALCTVERRVELLRECGADEVAIVRFTQELAAMEAERFVEDVLVGCLGAVHVSVGANFGFGRGRAGTPQLLRLLGEEHGFTVDVAPLVEVGGEPVSSSRTRALVREGRVDAASRMLGRTYAVDGFVVQGDGRGRQLGFPTANVARGDHIVCPAEGVYAGAAVLQDGRSFRSAVSVGTNPTFAGVREVRIEAHLLDFDEDIYGQPITIEFERFLRGQETYTSLDALIAQIERDVQASR